MWAGLIEIYGSAIEREYGLDPPALWLEAISGLTDDELRRIFASLLKTPRKFPPNLSEFVAAAREPGVRYLGVPLTSQQRKALMAPKPEVDHEKVGRRIDRLRRLAAGVPKDRA